MPAPTPVNVPIVDFAPCSLEKPLDTNDDKVKETVDEVVKALEDYGVLYLVNHGVNTDEIDNLRKAAREFFTLPMDIKSNSSRTAEHAAIGWIADQSEYLGEKNMSDLKECYNLTYRSLDNFPWPDDDMVPGFRSSNKKTIENLNLLAVRFFTILGEKLSPSDPDIFHRAFENFTKTDDNMTCLRSLYYPPISSYDKEISPDQHRLYKHSDYGIFSFVLQDECGGLEFEGRDGEWFEAKPLDGAIMMLAAHMLEIWTAGKIKDAPHRLRSVPNKEKARESTAYFLMPNGNFTVKPLDGTTTYPAVTPNEYVRQRMEKVLKDDDN